MLWDPDSETVNIKVPKPAEKVHKTEVISAFGWTDTTEKSNDTAGTEQSASAPTSPAGGSTTTPTTCPADSAQHKELQQHQKKLPKLPVPELKDTMKLYLSSLEGLLNAEEYENSRTIVEDFIESGVGENLQDLLKRHAAKPDIGASWIEDFWDDAYLCGRDPIPINVNYFFGFEDHPDKTKMTQVGRAASLLHAAVETHVLIRDQKLSTDMERGAPLCMSQYRRVFAASRVPGEKRDSIVTYTTSAPCEDEIISHTSHQVDLISRHVIVMARNRMFKLNVLDDSEENPMPLPLNEILRRLAFVHVVASRSKDKVGAPVGVFTTMNRDDWFETHSMLQELNPTNAQNLVDIQSAILVVCFDPTVSENETEAARLYLHGTGTNRWFDRHNLIVTDNGCAGINFEHSVGDGATTLRVADMMYRADCKSCPSAEEVAEVIKYWTDATEGAKTAKCDSCSELKWTLDGTLDALMKSAFDDYIRLIESNETIALRFTQFGGNWIKKAKFSPDAFVQLSFQLTYYRLFGRNDATYEAASTRSFLHGRTEVVRSVTRAAADFCAAASQPVFSRRINSKVPSTFELMKSACEDHVGYMRKAKGGLGVDRHMLGLRLVCMMNHLPLHPIFTDPAFSRSSHWNLSTSHCGSSALNLFGFGPVVADGIGLGYMIKNDEIAVVVTSKYTHKLTSSTIFASMLESSLLQMRAICESQPEHRREQKPQALNFKHPTGVPDFTYDQRSGFRYRAQSRSLYSSNTAETARTMTRTRSLLNSSVNEKTQSSEGSPNKSTESPLPAGASSINNESIAMY